VLVVGTADWVVAELSDGGDVQHVVGPSTACPREAAVADIGQDSGPRPRGGSPGNYISGLGKETVRRWVVPVEIDAGARPGTSSEESAAINRLKAENRRLREDSEILRKASIPSLGSWPPQSLIMAFIVTCAARAHAVESI
jgi:hypothetical protein